MEDDPFASLADRFLEHYQSIRGIVRFEMISRQLDCHLPPAPAKIVDIGGGDARQAIRLARLGYEVTVLDPSPEMLSRAQDALASEGAGSTDRVKLIEGWGQQAPELIGDSRYDGVLCHGVLAYIEDPDELIGPLARLLAPGGILSIVTKNAAALAFRPALQGRFSDALALFDSDRDIGNLGTMTRGDTVDDLEARLSQVGVELVEWYGVRVLTDHLTGVPPGPDLDEILTAEWEASRRDPYRRVSRMLHLVGQRRG